MFKPFRQGVGARLRGLMLLMGALLFQKGLHAQDLKSKSFDQDLDGISGGWGAERSYSWDPALDGTGSSDSGSLRADVDFSSSGDTTLQGTL
ncbi:MAG: hypothetical protein EXS21_10940, partial [Pedosphaera sp.]|nr:hypothetical protein [Pedosphaera sp.]